MKSLVRKTLPLRNLVAPINRLPSEILSAIFEYSMDEPPPVNLGAEEFKNPQWPKIHSVCQYWRQVALGTSKLWSYIYSPPNIPISSEGNVVSMSLSRAGAIPLRFYIQGDHRHLLHNSVKRDVLANAHRIRDLRVVGVDIEIADYIVQEGEQLETLVLHVMHLRFDDWPSDRDEEFGLQGEMTGPGANTIIEWKLPRLQTLVVKADFRWIDKTTSLRTLRHLVLDHQRLSVTFMESLHQLLASNPQLEDLVLHDLQHDSWENIPATLNALPLINLPALRRIHVKSYSSNYCSALGLAQKLRLTENHAIDYARLPYEAILTHFKAAGQHHYFPVDKLFVGTLQPGAFIGDTRGPMWPPGHIIGTDGRASFRALTDGLVDLLECLVLPHQPPIRELWWWLRVTDLLERETSEMAIETMHAMTAVTTLVLKRDIPAWLNIILVAELFTAVSELQLHYQMAADQKSILSFLKAVREKGRGIDTLRFVQDSPSSSATAAFDTLRGSVALFQEFVPNVFFEEYVSGYRQRMELPDLCTTPSSVHAFWPAWDYELWQK